MIPVIVKKDEKEKKKKKGPELIGTPSLLAPLTRGLCFFFSFSPSKVTSKSGLLREDGVAVLIGGTYCCCLFVSVPGHTLPPLLCLDFSAS